MDKVFTLKNKDMPVQDDKLKALSKEKALATIGMFRKQLGLVALHTTKERFRNILEKSGSLSEEVTKMRVEEI